MLQATAVSKSFFSNKVLDSIDFDVRSGEVHGLVGENGAGKSTLINIIGGILQRDSGAIVFDGHEVNFTHPLEAMGAGISVVHQELSLVPNATVTENIFLRREKRNALGLNDWRAMTRAASQVFRKNWDRHRPRRFGGEPERGDAAARRSGEGHFDRRQAPDHGRADLVAVGKGNRRAFQSHRRSPQSGPGDHLRLPQALGALQDRRPCDGPARRTPRGHGRNVISDERRPDPDDGRPAARRPLSSPRVGDRRRRVLLQEPVALWSRSRRRVRGAAWGNTRIGGSRRGRTNGSHASAGQRGQPVVGTILARGSSRSRSKTRPRLSPRASFTCPKTARAAVCFSPTASPRISALRPSLAMPTG